MPAYFYLLIPFFGALNGWLIVRLLQYLLFHPVKPLRLAGFTLQGFYPARQQQLGESIGQAVADAFRQLPDMAESIRDPALMAGLLPGIEAHINTFLYTRLQEKIPVVATFMGESTLQKIKCALMEEIELLLPGVIGQYAEALPNQLPVAQLAAARIQKLTPAALEGRIRSAYGRELRWACLLGAAVGLLLGMLQAAMLLLLA